jgi:hypothetical protein
MGVAAGVGWQAEGERRALEHTWGMNTHAVDTHATDTEARSRVFVLLLFILRKINGTNMNNKKAASRDFYTAILVFLVCNGCRLLPARHL